MRVLGAPAPPGVFRLRRASPNSAGFSQSALAPVSSGKTPSARTIFTCSAPAGPIPGNSRHDAALLQARRRQPSHRACSPGGRRRRFRSAAAPAWEAIDTPPTAKGRSRQFRHRTGAPPHRLAMVPPGRLAWLRCRTVSHRLVHPDDLADELCALSPADPMPAGGSWRRLRPRPASDHSRRPPPFRYASCIIPRTVAPRLALVDAAHGIHPLPAMASISSFQDAPPACAILTANTGNIGGPRRRVARRLTAGPPGRNRPPCKTATDAPPFSADLLISSPACNLGLGLTHPAFRQNASWPATLCAL